MTSIGTLFGVEIAKLVRRPMSWIMVVILLGFSALMYGALILTLLAPGLQDAGQSGAADSLEGLREQILMPSGFGFGISLAQSIGVVLIIVLAAGTLGSEFSWGTLRTMMLMRADRTRVLIAKWLTLVTAAVLITLIGIAVGFAGSIIAGLALGEGLRITDWATTSFLRTAAIASLATLVAVALWALIAATVTIFTRSLAGGIGVTLASFFIGDMALGVIASIGRVGVWVSRMFPNTAISALNQLGMTSNPPHYGASDWAWIIANLVIYAVVLASIAIVRIRKVNLLTSS